MNANPNTIPIKENATLLVRAGADVFIRGWDQPELEVLCDGERFFSEDADGKMARLVVKNDLYLSVPLNVPVRVEHIGGDALISGIAGRLEVQKVGGDVMIEKCAQVDLSTTGGDLTARKISGPFNIQKVGGDLRGEELAGGLSVESVGGDANFQAASGGLRLRVGGDLVMSLPGSGSEEVVLKAGGDVSIFVPASLGAQLDLSSGGRDVRIDVGGQSVSSEDPTFMTTLGDGARQVRARAGGDIEVSDKPWDADDLSDEFEEQIDHWEEWKSNQGMRQMDWHSLENRIRRRAEDGARRAEERVHEAMERVERQNRRQGGPFGPFGFQFGNFNPQHAGHPQPPAPPAPPTSPSAPYPTGGPASANDAGVNAPEYPTQSGVTSDERMLVLKMLQEHKISLEEADQLLKSLEGDFD